jgi:curved DNA-binding protein CbpA
VIHAAHRALVDKYSTEPNGTNPDAERMLKRVRAAYRVLGDSERRTQYDELTSAPEEAEEDAAPPEVPLARREQETEDDGTLDDVRQDPSDTAMNPGLARLVGHIARQEGEEFAGDDLQEGEVRLDRGRKGTDPFVLGFAAGFVGGCIGWVLVMVFAKRSETKKGATLAMVASIVVLLLWQLAR